MFKVICSFNNISSKYKESCKNGIGIVNDIKKESKRTILTISAKEKLLIYFNGNVDIDLGDKIKVIGNIEPITNIYNNFYSFNYKNYMISKNIYNKIIANKIIILNKNKNIFYKLKNNILKRINKMKSSRYLKAFILGDSTSFEDKAKNSYITNGISHLFAVSGMHITLISSIVLLILSKIKKSNINYMIVISLLIIYTFLVNFTPSAIRAVFLFSFISLNKILKLNLSTIRMFMIVTLFVLIANPYNLYNIGFKFSYTISFYLILSKDIINRNKSFILKLLFTSLIAFLASIPILINNYSSINLISIFSNLIFVPTISFVIFPLSIIIFIFPKLEFIYFPLINFFESLSLFISKFKVELILCHMKPISILLYYLIIVMVIFEIFKKNYKFIIIIYLILIIHSKINYIKNNPFITFIDVGQGDSTLIHLPYNKGDILIDTGGVFNYNLSNNIINYLKSEGISKLDYLILTHGDYDHIGSALNLIKSFKIKEVIMNSGNNTDLEKEILNTKIKYRFFNKNTLIINKYKLYFLNAKNIKNENNDSLVILTKINNLNILLMGDAEKSVENNIINEYNLPKIDILKVGHHGSSSGTKEEFVKSIHPKTSIISVGLKNKYNHPSKEVINVLKKYNSNIFLTSTCGSIKINLKTGKLKCAM